VREVELEGLSGRFHRFGAFADHHDTIPLRDELFRFEPCDVNERRELLEELRDALMPSPSTGRWQFRWAEGDPGHIRIQLHKQAWDVTSPKRLVASLHHVDIFLFAHATLPLSREV
jgi:hypothetical protein